MIFSESSQKVDVYKTKLPPKRKEKKKKKETQENT